MPKARAHNGEVAATRPNPVPGSRRARRLADGPLAARRRHGTGSHVRPNPLRTLAIAVVAAAVSGALVGAAASVTRGATDDAFGEADAAAALSAADTTPGVEALPVPVVAERAPTDEICALSEVAAAVEAGDDAAVIAASGGADALRTAVAAGDAPCIRLDDPARLWMVVNKARPYDPADYRPAGLVMPEGVRNLAGGAMRDDAAAALEAMVAAAADAGVGEIALASGYRSYQTQVGSYGRQVSSRGVAGADLVSARPGHSEHQSGLTADVVACGNGCGSLDDLAGTPQGDWIVAHAWEHGWIVRYEAGKTDVTGYSPEPWHLRYIGVDLARAYHEGEWRSLEEFLGLDAAPDYRE